MARVTPPLITPSISSRPPMRRTGTSLPVPTRRNTITTRTSRNKSPITKSGRLKESPGNTPTRRRPQGPEPTPILHSENTKLTGTERDREAKHQITSSQMGLRTMERSYRAASKRERCSRRRSSRSSSSRKLNSASRALFSRRRKSRPGKMSTNRLRRTRMTTF